MQVSTVYLQILMQMQKLLLITEYKALFLPSQVKINSLLYIVIGSWFLALLDFVSAATMVGQQSCCHGAGVRHPSVNSGCSETVACMMYPGQILWEATYLQGYLSPGLFFFLFSKFSLFKFLRFFFVFINIDPMGTRISKEYCSQF